MDYKPKTINTNQFEGRESFESRKRDHIHWSLSPQSQINLSPSDEILLPHDALPEIDFSEVEIKSTSKIFQNQKPFLISSMTGGHSESENLNEKLLEVANKNKWLFSTGSLRREVEDKDLKNSEWLKLRSKFPDVMLIGNIGLPQIIDVSLRKKLIHFLNEGRFNALFVHLNPLQEALQVEGTPNYKNGLESLMSLKEELKIPLLVKETGTGFSKETLKKISSLKIKALDVSGLGGTHWGRIEGLRTEPNSMYYKAAHTFKDWGHSTVESLLNAKEILGEDNEIWASGGLRSGLDAVSCFALGADVAGFAMPFMKAALDKEEALQDLINQIEYETRVALFCTGSKSIDDLKSKGGWSWK